MFEVSNPLAVNSAPDGRGKNDNFVGASVRIAAGASARGKVFLPSRSGDSFRTTVLLLSGFEDRCHAEQVGSNGWTPACEDERPTWATGVAA
jgi:hypothetical protein